MRYFIEWGKGLFVGEEDVLIHGREIPSQALRREALYVLTAIGDHLLTQGDVDEDGGRSCVASIVASLGSV